MDRRGGGVVIEDEVEVGVEEVGVEEEVAEQAEEEQAAAVVVEVVVVVVVVVVVELRLEAKSTRRLFGDILTVSM